MSFCLLNSFFITIVFANEAVSKSLVRNADIKPIINEIVSYLPVDNHHYNLQAPQTCGPDGTIDKSTRVIKCQFHSPGDHNIILSVCDDANTYCKNEKIVVSVKPQVSKNPRIAVPATAETVSMQNEVKEKLKSDFKSMTVAEAKAALGDKKAVLVMVSTDWCPPCNVSKEFLLANEEYKKKTKDFLLVYVDGDSAGANEWMPIVKSYFYPTFIVLNRNFESVSLFTDIESVTHFKKLEQALTLLDDPYSALEARIKKRNEGKYLQKFYDLFATEDSIIADEDRLLNYLQSRGQYKEQLEAMKIFSEDRYANLIQMAELKTYLMGQQSAELSADEVQKNRMALATMVLNSPVVDDDFHSMALEGFCASTKDLKTQKNSSQCANYANKYETHLKTKMSKMDKNLFDSEKILNTSGYYQMLAKISEYNNNSADMSKNYKRCFDGYEKLYALTPLKEKSRAVRFQQLYCLKELDQSKKNLDVIMSLAKDYPYEETFQRKLTSYYLDKKEYAKALEYNEKALKYSYGFMWAQNMSLKAKIFTALNKKAEAIKVLDEALGEIVLQKDSKFVQIVAMLRAQKDTLK